MGARAFRNTFRRRGAPVDIYLAVVDHFEPWHGQPPREEAMAHLEEWLRRYPAIAAPHRDADGRPPAHTFFYPWDEFDGREFIRLSELCAGGWGKIELHLHHQNDTEESLRRKLREAVAAFTEHGALSRWPDGRPAFGFVHGDWALNNSRSGEPGGHCGVNDEIRVLLEEGCYADFTFPSWQCAAQPRMVNRIYRAESRPDRPKGHDTGTPVRVGDRSDAGLLLVQGPLVPYLHRGEGPAEHPGGPADRPGWHRVRPAMDDGDLAASRRYHPSRLDRWVRAGIGVAGRPDRIFVKLHCHGAADGNRQVLLEEDLPALFDDAERRYNDGSRFRLHYVTAREMANVILATIDGTGNPPEAAGGAAAGAPAEGEGGQRNVPLPPPPHAPRR